VAVIIFHVLSGRGSELLDELERRTGELPYLQSRKRREYYEGGPSAFDLMLTEIDPAWPEHVRRSDEG
jgi:hypothetical protein